MTNARSSRRSEGTLQRRREKLPWPRDRRFRILSIDGGGIRGILPATLLADIEQRYCNGVPIGEHFDLIAGTSTGGIIALALAIGLPASRIASVYAEHGDEIFPAPKRFRAARRLIAGISSLRSYKYDREPLERELRQVFGNATMGDATRRLCVPSFDGFTEVNVFKTPHHPDFKLDWREELVTVALATSAAPTFFSVYANGDRRFADGGVWANNPVMIGLVDALTCNELDAGQVDILSLGCGESEMIISDPQVRLGGLWHWRGVIASAMHLASQNALGQAGLLIGRDRLVRVDGPLMDVPIALDDVTRAMSELPVIAHGLVDKFGDQIADVFLRTLADPYSAFHGPRA
ncbi:MAG: patatin [Sphingomonas sp.]|uniref:CBASS cGAMP-activated phospholipase n=1 Tax=Sphingomonas sp. TaxID=28214 RepID=UPI0011F9A2A3|nr:CBASS cGAMP-activated phospholipase [Sphingomonas sp.]THD34492.1 MAG: patatin [Sphingomonas sp.]